MDSLVIVQREAALIATRSFQEALTTEISGQKDHLNSIEEMQTELRSVNLRMLQIG